MKCALLPCTTVDLTQATNVAESAVISFRSKAGYISALEYQTRGSHKQQASTHRPSMSAATVARLRTDASSSICLVRPEVQLCRTAILSYSQRMFVFGVRVPMPADVRSIRRDQGY